MKIKLLLLSTAIAVAGLGVSRQVSAAENRGRIQIQGSNPYVEKSFSWSGQENITAKKALTELDKLWNSLTKVQQQDRLKAYSCAKQYINNSKSNGGIVAPPMQTKSCTDNTAKDRTARIDFEIYSGKAFH